MPDKAFFGKLFTLASGTLVGQLLVVASAPLLTRLFTPSEFGLFAVFAAVTAIIAIAACLRLEFAIPVVDDDVDAAALVFGAGVVATLNALLTVLLVLLFGPWLVALIDAEPIVGWLWLVPLAIWIWGLGSLLSYWSLRRGRYRINGINRMLTLGTQAGAQIGLGFTGIGAPGLILGYVLGYVVRLGHHIALLAIEDRRLFARVRSVFRVWRVVRANWRYPAFIAPSAFLHNMCEMLPAVAIAGLYGPAAAGWYALGQRIMSIPVKLLGEAASEVFLGEGRGLQGAALYRFFLRTTALFVTLGVAGVVPVLLFAPSVFALVFGADWLASGIFVQLLVPLYLARFISHPVSQLLNILHRQDLQFVASWINLIALVVSFGVGYWLDLTAETTILIFSTAAAGSFLFTVIVSWRLARHAGDVVEPSGAT